MIKFLIKGIIRDRSRSLFPIIMVSIGAFLTVSMYSWFFGVMGDMVKSSAVFDTGHVKVVTRAYKKIMDQIPNDLAILNTGKLLGELKDSRKDMIWQARIRFGGLLDIPDTGGETRIQAPMSGLGIDIFDKDSKETVILGLKKAIVRGSLPKNKNEILISDEFANQLKVSIGNTATLIGSTMNGEMATHNFIIAGTIRFGITALDKSAVIADLNDVRQALDMNDGASEIVGYTRDMVYNNTEMNKLKTDFNAKFLGSTDKFSPEMMSLTDQRGMGEIVGMIDYLGGLIIMIFVFAMSIVLWNSGLMNSLRRYGEIGIRIALGEEKGRVYRSMIIESIVIGIIGSVIGTMFGLALSYYLQYVGLDLSSLLHGSSMLMTSEIRARVDSVSYFIAFIPGLIASVVGTCFAGIGIFKRQTSQLFKELET